MRPSVSFCSSTSARCSSSEDGLALGLQLAQVVHRVAADVADRHAALLGEVAHDLDELAAALFGQLGDDQPDELPSLEGCQADVGLVDRLLDRLDRGLVVGLDGQQPRLGRGDRRELVQRRLRAVVVDRRRGPAAPGWRGRCAPSRTRAGRTRPTCPSARGRPRAVRRSGSQWPSPSPPAVDTSVPTRSPEIIRARLVSSSMLKTLIGMRVLHAQRQRRRVHHPQAPLDRLHVGDLGDELRVGSSAGSAV